MAHSEERGGIEIAPKIDGCTFARSRNHQMVTQKDTNEENQHHSEEADASLAKIYNQGLWPCHPQP